MLEILHFKHNSSFEIYFAPQTPATYLLLGRLIHLQALAYVLKARSAFEISRFRDFSHLHISLCTSTQQTTKVGSFNVAN